MASERRNIAAARLYFEETPFEQLMQNRIVEVLMVCSSYDRFVLEEDGRIEEQLFQEYASLGLRHPPRFSFAATAQEALVLLATKRFDLIISMLHADGSHAFDLVSHLKEHHPNKPVAVLTRLSGDESAAVEQEAPSHVRHVFRWLGNSNILLAIVKLLEDGMNLEHDANVVGVQTIILVEDSVRYYSSYLPIIYRILFEQARASMQEGLNEHQQTLRMRGRPKILLATTYEQALDLYERYRDNLLGVISDISYRRGDRIDEKAGLELCRHMRRRDPDLPILLQSSQLEHAVDAEACRAAFIHKQSKTLLNDLRAYIRRDFGFGDFIFVEPNTRTPIDRAANLVDLQHKIESVPTPSLEYHARANHFSTWLKARSLYSLANIVRHQRADDFGNIELVRQYLVDTVRNYRLHVGRGTIGCFDKRTFDESSVFHRMGHGSLGGKARGIALINNFLKHSRIMFKYDGVAIQIPKTVVLTTDIFEQFMEANDLYAFALEDQPDELILERFLQAHLPAEIEEDLLTVATVVRRPLAVRSSSVLEDSRVQPFAGVYATYFAPNNAPSVEDRVQRLSMAIKGVYASTYFRGSKSYAVAAQSLIEEEKMAVIIQEVTGMPYGDLYYPNVSGVARSLNFYPIEYEQPEEGVVNVALGLGKTVVEGRPSLRFSPAHPKKLFQLSDPKLAMRSTQRKFYGLDLTAARSKISTDQAYNLRHAAVAEAARHRANARLISTFDVASQAVRHDPDLSGPKLVTFASVLTHGTFPLAAITRDLLEIGSREMNAPVEIEFACNLDVPRGTPRAFKVLQIRPIVEGQELEALDHGEFDCTQALITASTALGHGLYRTLHDLIFVRPDSFDPSRTARIAETIAKLNQRLQRAERRYILVGPGRWGSSDPWLGIPVQWADITNARVIVEASLQGLRVEASQGSHFFQNITAHRVAYLTIDPSVGDGTYDVGYLESQPAAFEDEFVRHLRFDAPLIVKIDGHRSAPGTKAVVLKPDPPQA